MAEIQSTVVYKSLSWIPKYKIGSDGTVLSQSQHVMKPCTDPVGRQKLYLRTADGKPKSVLVHRLVLEAFVGPCPEGMECCHHDGNPANNTLSNLRWDTRKANMVDKIRHGTSGRGKRHWSKLTAEIVRQIRAEYAAGGVSYRQLISKYKLPVTKHAISSVIHRKTWKEVK